MALTTRAVRPVVGTRASVRPAVRPAVGRVAMRSTPVSAWCSARQQWGPRSQRVAGR